MVREDLVRNIKLIVVIALVIGILGAAFYLIYGFAFFWQAMVATLFSILLSIIAILFIFLSIYLWIKNLLLKRELNKVKDELEQVRYNLTKCNSLLNDFKKNLKD
jgi:predicted membrane protein